MSASEIERTLVRLAHEIVEKNDGGSNLGLVGIKRRGVPLAQRLGALIEKIEKHPIDVGVLDISFYRDDLSTAGPRPTVVKGELGFDVTVLSLGPPPPAVPASNSRKVSPLLVARVRFGNRAFEQLIREFARGIRSARLLPEMLLHARRLAPRHVPLKKHLQREFA